MGLSIAITVSMEKTFGESYDASRCYFSGVYESPLSEAFLWENASDKGKSSFGCPWVALLVPTFAHIIPFGLQFRFGVNGRVGRCRGTPGDPNCENLTLSEAFWGGTAKSPEKTRNMGSASVNFHILLW